jgi:hypothetical protein
VRRTLPIEYHDLIDVFSKKDLDTLSPRRKGIDLKIELEKDADPRQTIRYAPLYLINTEELAAAKKYLQENLRKGFITTSNASIASLVLIAPKLGGGLRFYIDYRKLNSITKKNRYPLLLINETLTKLGKAD